MSRFVPFVFSLSLPLATLAQTAAADLTPVQVWGDWKQYMTGLGYQIDATETVIGDDLVLGDISLSFNLPEPAVTMTTTIGTVTYTQNDDGTVSIRVPESLPVELSFVSATPGPDDATLQMTVTQAGHTTLASGTPDAITYSYTSDMFSVVLDQLRIGDESFGAENARFSLTGRDVASQTEIAVGEARSYDQSGSLGALAYDVFIDNPEETAKVSLTGGVEDMSWQGGGTIPGGFDSNTEMGAMIRQGFDVTGQFAYGGGNTQMTVVDPVNGGFDLQTSTSGGTLGVEIGADGLVYKGAQDNLDVAVVADGVPLPITFQLEKGGFTFAAPVLKSEEEQDFTFALQLGNLALSNIIWATFDPAGQLPRDPLTLEIDTMGKALLKVDYLDPEAVFAIARDGLGELRALTVNKLLINAAGALFQGSADVTLDNTDKTTIPGVPKPVGQIDMTLEGGNGLLSKLTAMGLLPSEQALGARVILGVLGVPDGGADKLKSKIEFSPEGDIIANGLVVQLPQ